jgi:hypothetical protein
MYVAVMANDCPLSAWGSNSRVDHVISSTPEGPYIFHDTALPVWAHNPQVVVQNNADGSATFLLFHIGDANGGNPANCTPSTAEALSPGDGAADAHPLEGAPGSTLHVASDPNGPWTPVLPAPPGCNNPAPLLHPNGTWYLLCDSSSIVTAPSFVGPWTAAGSISTAGGVPGTYEDAFMYLSPDASSWHVIYHVYNATTPCGACLGTMVSGHAFSADGVTWHQSPVQPFDNVYGRTDGVNVTVSTRERPKLLFNSAGVPTHLSNGVCQAVTCPPTPGGESQSAPAPELPRHGGCGRRECARCTVRSHLTTPCPARPAVLHPTLFAVNCK